MSDSAVCPGSFDPVTNGHVDVIERAATHFDRLIVACLRNVGKQPLFELERRLELLESATAHLDNVEIASFDGLLVDFCRRHDVRIVVRGLRAVSDFESELEMAQMNHRLADVETFFVATSPVYSFLSSTLVKEVARFGGDVAPFVPPEVGAGLREMFQGRGSAEAPARASRDADFQGRAAAEAPARAPGSTAPPRASGDAKFEPRGRSNE